MKKTGLVMIWVCVCMCSLTAQRDTPPLVRKSAAELRSDISLLKKILEANHPSLYWYTPKDSMDLFFEQSINSITDSLDEVQFKNKVAWIVSKIRCGHTTVMFSKNYTKRAAHYRYPSFPLYLKTWGDSIVVLANMFTRNPVLKRGTVITGINGKTNRQLLDTLFQYISSDGYAFNYKSQVLSGNFPAWYKTVLGVDSSYTINYIDSSGMEASTVLNNFKPIADTTRRRTERNLPKPKLPSRRELRKARLLAKRDLYIDTANSTAVMRLATFSNGRLRGFFRRSFRTIRKQHIEHLVIDLRENGGGKVSSSILLTKYLSDHPFKVGDTIAAASRKFKYGRYISPAFIYWFPMYFASRKMEDGRIHARRYETNFFEPKSQNHFNGQLTLIQGGYSFSATTLFIGTLKGQKNVTVAGEESGGGYYGNSAMFLPTITLPNSKLRISLPMYRLVMDTTRVKGHGIVPDLFIPPSTESIKGGYDPKMRTIMDLIQQKKL